MNQRSLLDQIDFIKKLSVQGNKTNYVDAPYPKAVKMQLRKRLKKRKEREVAVGNSRNPSFSFCQQIGYKITNCHVRNSYEEKHGPELDTKATKFGLISQIEFCDMSNLHDFSSGLPTSNLAKKQMNYHLIIENTILKQQYDRFKSRHDVKKDILALASLISEGG